MRFLVVAKHANIFVLFTYSFIAGRVLTYMKRIKTLQVYVNEGKVSLDIDLPEVTDGTQLELRLLLPSKSLKDQLEEQIEREKSLESQRVDVEIHVLDRSNEFRDLGLDNELVQAIKDQGYSHPTPIQSQAIPIALKKNDILATAQTGSGKTAGFSLPIIQLLNKSGSRKTKYIRALVVSPTRELASQIGENIDNYAAYTDLRQVTIYGGVSQKPQEKRLRKKTDILVATPGRLLDLIGQEIIDISKIEIFVLDEADRMLDMGFIHDIRRIMKLLPSRRQTMLFSATMPSQIQKLSDKLLFQPQKVSVDPPATTVETIDSSVFFVEKSDKVKLLVHLIKEEKIKKALVFMRTKHTANRLVKKLMRHNIIADAIHGNKSQTARERALNDFKQDKISVLVATDIAARGIDIDDISHVINYDMSNLPETYVHRIGRTARAGKSGIAYNFCDQKEREYLIAVERLIKQHLIRATDYPYASPNPAPAMTDLFPENRKKKTNKNKPRKRSRNRAKAS